MHSFAPPRSAVAKRNGAHPPRAPLASPRAAHSPRQFSLAADARRKESAPRPPMAPRPADRLPERLQTVMEAMSGFSLADVVVHRNSAEPARLGAAAFTKGEQIHLAPGQEQHLPHEAWHVVQQAQGRVRPTAQMKGGIAVNDDSGLEHEADAMGARAAAGPASFADAGPIRLPAAANPPSAAIQCKGPITLAEALDKAVLPDTAVRLKESVKVYDDSKDGRPAAQLELLLAIDREIAAWNELNSEKASNTDREAIKALTDIVAKEIQAVTGQAKRLETFSADEAAPYEQMTSEGLLWKHEGFKDRASKLSGFKYFEDLSARNIQDLDYEVSKNKLRDSWWGDSWFTEFEKKALAALQGAVLSHYTTAVRAALLTREGLQSRTVLEKTKPEYRHNTSVFDEVILSNTGFVFFFIEAADAPARNTRFAKSDKDDEGSARIKVPIAASGLLKTGWVMLSDFAQREYPTIRERKDGKVSSELPTREDKDKNKLGTLVRKFTPSIASDKDLQADVLEMQKLPQGSPQRQMVSTVNTLVRGDTGDRQVYGAKGQLQALEQIRNNILVGADILPGLAKRAALEVARISAVNPNVGKTLKALSGKALLLFILKDLFRPQAMIPLGVKIEDKFVEILEQPQAKGQQQPSDKKVEGLQPDKASNNNNNNSLSVSSSIVIQAPKSDPVSISSSQGKKSGDRKALIKWGVGELEKVRELWRAQKSKTGKDDPPSFLARIDVVESILMAPVDELFERMEKLVEDTIAAQKVAAGL